MNTDETDVLSGITGPNVLPQTDPDKLTKQEIKKAKKQSDRPSPGIDMPNRSSVTLMIFAGIENDFSSQTNLSVGNLMI